MATPVDFRRRGGRADQAFTGLTFIAGAIVLVILALVAIVMTSRAWPAFSEMGLRYFTSSRWAPAQGEYGILAFIYGTVISSTIALLIAVPVSLAIALFVTQIAPDWLRKPIVYVVDLLAVIPSVVFGLWGVQVFAPKAADAYGTVHDVLGNWPIIGPLFGPASGRSFFTAGVILAVMITPIITSLSREVIATTPPGDREAALALGATRWEMIRGAVIPHSRGGLVGAVMLGLGRAMGETIAVALVIGSSKQITANLFAPGDSMPGVIANEWGEASGTYRAALLGLAVTLFVITILVNVSANAIVRRSNRRSQGA